MSSSAATPAFMTPAQLMVEREARKAMMQTSNWVAAAEGGAREYIPVSSTPLESAYMRSKSVTRSEYLERLQTQSFEAMAARDRIAPAADFVAGKYKQTGAHEGQGADGTTMVLGYDGRSLERSNTAYGASLAVPTQKIDLLQSVPKLRDTTLDGSHRASMTEGHFLEIWDPYDALHKTRSKSFQSAVQLREAHHRHIRSQYHPHEKYLLPPSVQNDMGWKLDEERYRQSCAK